LLGPAGVGFRDGIENNKALASYRRFVREPILSNAELERER